MRKWTPLLMLLFLLAGCGNGQALEAETPEPIPQVQTEPPSTPEPTPTPTPTPEPTPTPTPEPTPYDYTVPVPASEAVDEGWFADAAFIGDSRTEGLRLYGGIEGADFFCYQGLTVFEVLENKAVIQTASGKVGVLQALQQGAYGKVYLSLGINELGYPSIEDFQETYATIVDKLRELEPDAGIYIQTIVPVSTEVCRRTGQASYVNNTKIAAFNEVIRAIAAEKQIYLLTPQEALTDETGELPSDASADGIHFYKAGYTTWYEYLKTHTVQEPPVLEEPEEEASEQEPSEQPEQAPPSQEENEQEEIE